MIDFSFAKKQPRFANDASARRFGRIASGGGNTSAKFTAWNYELDELLLKQEKTPLSAAEKQKVKELTEKIRYFSGE